MQVGGDRVNVCKLEGTGLMSVVLFNFGTVSKMVFYNC